MGYSMPATHGRRGAGLGNEVLPWAKAFLGAQELGLTGLHPAWGLNARGYSSDFETSRFDWLTHRSLRLALPTTRITAAMVRETGEDDYARALRALARELPLKRSRPHVVVHEGMNGGYHGIRRARAFLLHELLRPSHVSPDVYAISTALDAERITVAIHYRSGDFESQGEGPRPGEFNKSLPASWYTHVVTAFYEALGDGVQYLVVSDSPTHDLMAQLPEQARVVIPPTRKRPLLSDLLAMVGADVLVCSVSSFSMLAAFLSERPYIWYEPGLYNSDGWRSIWGHEDYQQPPNGVTAKNIVNANRDRNDATGRGFAVGVDGRLPQALLEILERQQRLKKQRHDLLYYGVIPANYD